MQDRVPAFRFGWSRPGDAVAGTTPAETLSIADNGIVVEDFDAAGAAAFVVPWRALAARSRDANAYFEPEFALAAAALAGGRLRFLFVWQGRRDRLLGVFPLILPRLPLPFGAAHAWRHKNSTCAMPLLDMATADRTWIEIVNHCRRRWPWLAALSVAGARTEPADRSADRVVYASFERAILDCSPCAEPALVIGERTLRKGRRRLERLGGIAFRLLNTPAEIAIATEAFLTLEAKGWKRGCGALASRPELATFARAAINGLAAQRRARIAALELDGSPIAMGIVLVSGRRAFFWKIAYDEAFAAYSPGALLTLDLTHALQGDPDIDVADSCSDPGHPMIEKLWPGREPIATVFVRIGRGFRVAVAAEIVRLEARRRLKEFVHGLRRPRRA